MTLCVATSGAMINNASFALDLDKQRLALAENVQLDPLMAGFQVHLARIFIETNSARAAVIFCEEKSLRPSGKHNSATRAKFQLQRLAIYLN